MPDRDEQTAMEIVTEFVLRPRDGEHEDLLQQRIAAALRAARRSERDRCAAHAEKRAAGYIASSRVAATKKAADYNYSHYLEAAACASAIRALPESDDDGKEADRG